MKKRNTTSVLNMSASSWKFRTENYNCIGCPVSPTQVDSFSWKFTIPDGLGKVGYIACPHKQPIDINKSIQATFEITGPTDTQFLDGKEPFNSGIAATVGICFSKEGFYDSHSRWWNLRRIRLVDVLNSSLTITCPFDELDKWQGVNGASDLASMYPNEYKVALANPGFVYLTFGAGGDFGHGIYSNNNQTTFLAKNVKIV